MLWPSEHLWDILHQQHSSTTVIKTPSAGMWCLIPPAEFQRLGKLMQICSEAVATPFFTLICHL